MVFLLCFFLVADVSYGINGDCELPKVVGPCRASHPRYYYNSSSKRCEKFNYGGCRGNANNFHTLEECEKVCGVRSRDSPKEN
uniref:U-actitoxin-Avd3p n=1 Tax=Anemonia viridis TaxID=51769 RepID=VKTD_ANEVI|nr:RecName: Full=U-actitoxin-Avd3p; Short=U-AITX-Avd3p; AltName: Full=AsKC13; Flags: Precursor [Anemonia viridis]